MADGRRLRSRLSALFGQRLSALRALVAAPGCAGRSNCDGFEDPSLGILGAKPFAAEAGPGLIASAVMCALQAPTCCCCTAQLVTGRGDRGGRWIRAMPAAAWRRSPASGGRVAVWSVCVFPFGLWGPRWRVGCGSWPSRERLPERLRNTCVSTR